MIFILNHINNSMIMQSLYLNLTRRIIAIINYTCYFSVYCTIYCISVCFCLLSCDNEAMALYKCYHSIHYFPYITFNKKTKLVLYWIILKGTTSRFGSAIQVLLSDIEEYLTSFINPVVVVVFIVIFIFQLNNVLLAL